MSTAETEIAQPRKLRLWWLWWLMGWVLIIGTVNEELQPRVWKAVEIFSNDKAMHCTGYFLLTVWFSGVVRRSRYLVMGASLIAFGGALEIAQGLMHIGRTADWFDFLANSVGVALGLAAASLGLGNWMLWLEKLVRARKA